MWYVVLLAGGNGSRMGAGRNKVLVPLLGKPALLRAAQAFAGLVDGMVIVVRSEDEQAVRDLLTSAAIPCPVHLTIGGDTRQASVWHGLQALPDTCDKVMIHDAARCLVDAETIRRVMASVESVGTGVAAIPCVDTVKTTDGHERAVSTPDRATLRAIQTPQGFTMNLIRQAHLYAAQDGFLGTDDASLVEHMGQSVQLTMGHRRNIKLTTPEDMLMAEAFLNSAQPLPSLRVGQGYDVHQLVENRPLVLCGVTVPHSRGLLGHSDADVALHALMDAMLGAMALGDIGRHFPDSDPQYKGISSMLLLSHVARLLAEHHARVANADITIVAQRPKLLPYIPQMRQNVAEALALPVERVNVKATTTERLGFEGQEEGISAQAVCLIQQL